MKVAGGEPDDDAHLMVVDDEVATCARCATRSASRATGHRVQLTQQALHALSEK